MATPTLTGSPSIQIGHSFGVRVPCFLAFRGYCSPSFSRGFVYTNHTNPAALAEKVVSKAVRIVMMISTILLIVFFFCSFIGNLLSFRLNLTKTIKTPLCVCGLRPLCLSRETASASKLSSRSQDYHRFVPNHRPHRKRTSAERLTPCFILEEHRSLQLTEKQTSPFATSLGRPITSLNEVSVRRLF